jgi:hypothetical protein
VRRLLVVPVCALALVWAPGVASADVIFDPADADELAATLAEAYEKQGVCYGWSIDVDNEGVPESSEGSNLGAGQRLLDSECDESVEFQASISWTPESSESEDSASYQVISTGNGPTTGDLDDLEILSEDGLVGDDVDVDVYKAVAALPLLAADAGLAEPMSASPAPEADAADAQATDSPGSDFWRQSGMQILWGSLILLAGVVFGWYAIKSSRREARRRARPVGPAAEQIPYEPEPYEPEPYGPEPYEPEPHEPESTGPAGPEPAGPEREPGSEAESEAAPGTAPEPAGSETADEAAEPSEKPPGKPPEKPETRPDE